MGPTLVLGLVVVAGLVRDAVLVRVGPHLHVVAALAGAGLRAVQDVLHRQKGGGPRPLPLDVDPICQAHPLESVPSRLLCRARCSDLLKEAWALQGSCPQPSPGTASFAHPPPPPARKCPEGRAKPGCELWLQVPAEEHRQVGTLVIMCSPGPPRPPQCAGRPTSSLTRGGWQGPAPEGIAPTAGGAWAMGLGVQREGSEWPARIWSV